jgi:hypothetical protein
MLVAAEVDLINNRLLGTERQKLSVLPVLLAGEKTASLPPLLHGRVYADFRDELGYFTTAFDLILSIYGLQVNDPKNGSWMPVFCARLWRTHSCVQRSHSCERASSLTRLVATAFLTISWR